jgi:hypothetical protein
MIFQAMAGISAPDSSSAPMAATMNMRWGRECTIVGMLMCLAGFFHLSC